MKPRILDLFCGAGGAAMGYSRAGFEVVGVDIKPQPRYPFEFVQDEALGYLHDRISEPWNMPWVAIHASPPCQRWAEAGTNRRLGEEHPDLLTPTRELLKATGLPYVIENIPTAPMPESFLLCGATFGLPIIRHRSFEVHPSIGLVPSLCHQTRFARSVDHGPSFHSYARGSWEADWREHVLPVVWPWMTLEEAGEAIPPAYTEHVGAALMQHIRAKAAA